ncbi:MAG: 4Fe-4S dicluster domain-containing protein, partial [Deltaproteobacteria bacterium]|nr:4Fe-4S dicluster domain-containing protein [Deltaproteobacteria bacterium]
MPPLKPAPPQACQPGTQVELWRSADEREGSAHALPEPSTSESDAISRRGFLQLLGVASASVSLGACSRQPTGPLLPYTRQPTEVTPGTPLHFATSSVLGGYATGLLVQCWEGRPVKVEGNPEHPASLGATGVVHQALAQQLYDAQRAKEVRRAGAPSSWQEFVTWLASRGEQLQASGGAGLRFLLEATSSPLLADLRERILSRYPSARFHFFSPAEGDGEVAAARLLFGRSLAARYDLTQADVLVALDSDFANRGPFSLRYARELADRRVPQGKGGMNRLYCIEPTLTPTGTLADHRLRVRPTEVESFALSLLHHLAGEPAAAPRLTVLRELAARRGKSEPLERWSATIARDLARASPGRSLIVVGDGQPAAVHALALVMNAALGNLGRTVAFSEPVLLGPAGPGIPTELLEEMRAGRVDTLLVDAFNPVYSAPADAALGDAFSKVAHSIYRSLYWDETARAARWFLPAAHAFEAWSDARAFDGTVSTVQPLIAPLFNGAGLPEILALFAGLGPQVPAGFELLRGSWQRRPPGRVGELDWKRWMSQGMISGSSTAPVTTPEVPWERLSGLLGPLLRSSPPSAPGLELHLIPSRRMYDGRFLNVPWLLELPEPMTKLTWDNAALVSPSTARRLELRSGDVVRFKLRGRSVEGPVLVLPGQADDVFTLELGWGWEGAEEFTARGFGFNAYSVRFSDAPWFATGLAVEKTGREHSLVTTQLHYEMHGRPVALSATLDELRGGASPKQVAQQRGPLPKLYDPFAVQRGHQWAMAIDLSRCTGCSACVIACQAENNVPTVGQKGVGMGREMLWLRVDRYFRGPIDEPTETLNQPMACVHCEYAPCEYVCPVNATVHSEEGLNQMVYNRCIGTRYCSNNCPYKVRRFNFLAYTHRESPVQRMVFTPDVTVRSRGVMEKCTYCIQRIERARIQARIEGRDIPPGSVHSACAQVCPTRAIVFGD